MSEPRSQRDSGRTTAMPHDPARAGDGCLRVLFIEDNPMDLELTLMELQRAGFEIRGDVVQTPEDFKRRLHATTYDIVVSDYRLPGWTGMEALEHLQEEKKDVPFILMTGSLGEETAVECIKRGATDYVLKDRLVRLPVAVRRAMEERRLREERARLEDQLLQSQKMEAVGRLAGGVAHDFNNLLQIILSYAEIARERPGLEPEELEDLDEIKKAARRAANLTRQLLAFSRKQVLDPIVMDINTVLRDLVKMLQRLIGEDIEIRFVLAPEPVRVKADPGQIENVIMNLAVNARDAMPQGGVLTIETGATEVDQAYAREHPFVPPGPYVMVTVTDTGAGMDADVRSHIFEPFFTTKDPGKGTGLGLATVYGIVKQSGGHISVYSEPGRGSSFKILLPRVEESAVRERPARGAERSPRGSETILLVEDEPSLRKLVRQLLRGRGYTVIEAHDGAKALDAARKHKGPIQLLLTDVVMPGMSGRELAERLAPLRPEMKILYMSGYTDDAIVNHGVPGSGAGLIQKPFSQDALARKVHALLHPDSGH
jgi:two-component system cell cycle sensor histidine kinase/response regulator CckA